MDSLLAGYSFAQYNLYTQDVNGADERALLSDYNYYAARGYTGDIFLRIGITKCPKCDAVSTLCKCAICGTEIVPSFDSASATYVFPFDGYDKYSIHMLTDKLVNQSVYVVTTAGRSNVLLVPFATVDIKWVHCIAASWYFMAGFVPPQEVILYATNELVTNEVTNTIDKKLIKLLLECNFYIARTLRTKIDKIYTEVLRQKRSRTKGKLVLDKTEYKAFVNIMS